MYRLERILVVTVMAVFSGACGAPAPSAAPATTATQIPRLAAFSENGVSVEIELQTNASGQEELAATFTPEQPGFHLYSYRLPRDGVNGQGRPTLLEVPEQAALRTAGELVASQPSVLEPPALLVFPDGPVTLRLAVTRPQPAAEERAELSVTYMSCSARTCMTPVIDKRISVVLP